MTNKIRFENIQNWILTNKITSICMGICLVVILGYIAQNYILWGKEKSLYDWTVKYCPQSIDVIYDKAEYNIDSDYFYVIAEIDNKFIEEYALWEYLGYQDVYRNYSKGTFIDVNVTKVNKKLKNR